MKKAGSRPWKSTLPAPTPPDLAKESGNEYRTRLFPQRQAPHPPPGRSCALTAVSAFLATWLGRKEPAVRQQLREFCSEAPAKRGTARQELVVETCFGPLLAWVVDQWEGTQLALALDATTLET